MLLPILHRTCDLIACIQSSVSVGKKKTSISVAFITKETFGVIENIGCLYLTQLHGNDVTLPLLMPYNKTQIMRVVAAISDLESNIFVGVAAGYPD